MKRKEKKRTQNGQANIYNKQRDREMKKKPLYESKTKH